VGSDLKHEPPACANAEQPALTARLQRHGDTTGAQHGRLDAVAALTPSTATDDRLGANEHAGKNNGGDSRGDYRWRVGDAATSLDEGERHDQQDQHPQHPSPHVEPPAPRVGALMHDPQHDEERERR